VGRRDQHSGDECRPQDSPLRRVDDHLFMTSKRSIVSQEKRKLRKPCLASQGCHNHERLSRPSALP
jgi:hypothetical protein